MVDPGTPSGGSPQMEGKVPGFIDKGATGFPSRSVATRQVDLTAGVANSVAVHAGPVVILSVTGRDTAGAAGTINLSDSNEVSFVEAVASATIYPAIRITFDCAASLTTEAPNVVYGTHFQSGIVAHALTSDLTLTITFADLNIVDEINSLGPGRKKPKTTQAIMRPGLTKSKRRRRAKP